MKLSTTLYFHLGGENMNGEIYIIKNYINEKVYIGQTTQGSEIRFKQHLKLLKSNHVQLIHKAIKKYGKENFYYEVLESNIDLSKLDEREEYWIKKYNSFVDGYNLCAGGGQTRKPMSEKLINNYEVIKNRYISEDISLRSLSREYKIDHCSLSKALAKDGVSVSSRNNSVTNITENEKVKIATLYKSGLSSFEISKLVNRSERTVRRYKNYKCCA